VRRIYMAIARVRREIAKILVAWYDDHCLDTRMLDQILSLKVEHEGKTYRLAVVEDGAELPEIPDYDEDGVVIWSSKQCRGIQNTMLQAGFVKEVK
jgi:hypothetical protein